MRKKTLFRFSDDTKSRQNTVLNEPPSGNTSEGEFLGEMSIKQIEMQIFSLVSEIKSLNSLQKKLQGYQENLPTILENKKKLSQLQGQIDELQKLKEIKRRNEEDAKRDPDKVWNEMLVLSCESKKEKSFSLYKGDQFLGIFSPHPLSSPSGFLYTRLVPPRSENAGEMIARLIGAEETNLGIVCFPFLK